MFLTFLARGIQKSWSFLKLAMSSLIIHVSDIIVTIVILVSNKVWIIDEDMVNFGNKCIIWTFWPEIRWHTKFQPFSTLFDTKMTIVTIMSLTMNNWWRHCQFQKWPRFLSSSCQKCLKYQISYIQSKYFKNYEAFFFAIFNTKGYPCVKVFYRWRHSIVSQ